MPLPVVLLQLAAATAAPAAADSPPPRPTIELRARVRASEVIVAQQGEARLEVRVDPERDKAIKVVRDPPRRGEQRIRNLDLRLDAQATLGEPTPAGQSDVSAGDRAPPDEPPAAPIDR